MEGDKRRGKTPTAILRDGCYRVAPTMSHLTLVFETLPRACQTRGHSLTYNMSPLANALKAATPKFEVKRHGASGYSNDCMAVPLGGYSASNFAGSTEICLLDPGRMLFGLSSPGPLPQALADGGVSGAQGCLPGVVSVLRRPSSENRLAQTAQVVDLRLLVGLDDAADRLQERVHVLAGWLGKVCAVVRASMGSEAIEAVGDAGDDCLVLRECQPAFLPALLHAGFALPFQPLCRGAGDDAVVGRPDHGPRAAIGCLGVWRGALLRAPAFETIQCAVGQDRGGNTALWRTRLRGV